MKNWENVDFSKMAKTGILFENLISEMLSSLSIPFKTEKEIKRSDCSLNGVDHLIETDDVVVFIQEKWEAKNGRQQSSTQFVDASRRILESSSSFGGKRIIRVWLSKLPPSSNAMKTLENVGTKLICESENIFEDLNNFLIDEGVTKNRIDTEDLLEKLAISESEKPEIRKKIKPERIPAYPKFSETKFNSIKEIFISSESCSKLTNSQFISNEYVFGNSDNYLLIEMLKVDCNSPNIKFSIACGDDKLFNLQVNSGFAITKTQKPVSYSCFGGRLNIRFYNNVENFQMRVRLLQKNLTKKELEKKKMIEKLMEKLNL